MAIEEIIFDAVEFYRANNYRFIRDRITQLRMQKGVNEREMSYALGKSPTYINNITRGKSLPRYDGFLDICEYLGTTPVGFFDSRLKNPVLYRAVIERLIQLLPDDLLYKYHLVLEGLEPEEMQLLVKILLKAGEVSGKADIKTFSQLWSSTLEDDSTEQIK